MTRSVWTFPPLQKWCGWGMLAITAFTLLQDVQEQQWRQAVAASLACLFWFWGLKNGYAREARERLAAEAESRP